MAVDMNDYFKKSGNDQNKGNNSGGNGGFKGEFVPPKIPDWLNGGKKMMPIYIGLAILFFAILLRPFVIINSGETGILVTLGKYEKAPLYPGIHLFVPLMQKVIVVDTKIRIINYTSEDTGAIDKRGVAKMSPIQVLDSRGLPVEVELTIQYSLSPERAAGAIANLGLNWEEKTIHPNVRDVVRSVIGNFKAEDLPMKRDVIADLIAHNMQTAIAKIKDQPITVTSIQLRNIALPEKVKEQIERVQIANQEAERTKYEVERAKQEAQKAEETAKGIAQAKIIEAEGQAKANDLVGRSLTSNLVKLKQIEAQAKFNDALRENKDAKVFLTPSGAMPSIWMDVRGDDKERAAKEKSTQGATK
jgi:regulator of protease activity HflC (stomatin/prohibitin superfamily)